MEYAMVGKISKVSAEVTVDKFIPKRNDATGRPYQPQCS